MAVILNNSLEDKPIYYKYREQMERDAGDSDKSQPEVELLIDGKPMDEYFEHNYKSISMTKCTKMC